MGRTLRSAYLIGKAVVYSVDYRAKHSNRYHDPNASVEEGLATLKRCIEEVSKRLVVSPDRYKVKVVDKDGIREVEL